MKMKITAIITTITLCWAATALSDSVDDRVLESRKAILQFAGELKSRLKAALLEGGPTRAIDVCSKKAPEIAARFSNQTGRRIGRTSLKYRNPDNAPDNWEKEVLKEFQKLNREGKPVQEMEFKAVTEIDGKKYFRYMKAIGIKEVCLTCHGSSLAPDIEEEIDRLYPGDLARGYSVGDIRGAFTISQPLDE